MSGMQLQPITKSAAVVERLVEYFHSNDMQVGVQIPSEKELMDALGVGRSSLREAVRKLEATGIISIRQGTGTFLARVPTPGEVMVPLAIQQECSSLLHALDIRCALESHAAYIAAGIATRRQIDEIEFRLVEMEKAHREKGGALEEDLRFHVAIYEATNNPLFEQIIKPVRGPFLLFFSKPFEQHDIGNSSFPIHRELFEAIAQRDQEASRQKTLLLLKYVGDEIRKIASANP